jgi:hypothetical protein
MSGTSTHLSEGERTFEFRHQLGLRDEKGRRRHFRAVSTDLKSGRVHLQDGEKAEIYCHHGILVVFKGPHMSTQSNRYVRQYHIPPHRSCSLVQARS